MHVHEQLIVRVLEERLKDDAEGQDARRYGADAIQKAEVPAVEFSEQRVHDLILGYG